MRKITTAAALAVAIMLASVATAGARIVHVTTLPSADVSLANYTDCSSPGGNFTKLLSHGLHIGDFTGNLNVGGVNLDTNPAVGRALGDLSQLDYDGRALPSTTAGWSFLQIYLDNGGVVTYSPNTQPNGSQITGSGDWRNWDVVNGTARYDDAIGNLPDGPFSAIVAAHRFATVTGISVYGGPCSGSSSEVDLDAMHVAVRAEQVPDVVEYSAALVAPPLGPDNVTYDFGLANTGPQGPAGAGGAQGAQGAAGTNGSPGPQGQIGQAPAPKTCTSSRRVRVHLARGATSGTVSYVNGKGKRVSKSAKLFKGRFSAVVDFTGRVAVKGTVATVRISERVDGRTRVRSRALNLCSQKVS